MVLTDVVGGVERVFKKLYQLLGGSANMAVFAVFVIVWMTIENLHSAIISTPSSSNGTNEYFENNYEFDTIICSRINCHINCNKPQGCFKTNINASLSDTLSILCNQNSSCQSLRILNDGSPKEILNVYCGDYDESCADININIQTTKNINIICNYTSILSQNGICNNLSLNIIQSTNSVMMKCNGDYSCNGAGIYINNCNSFKLINDGVYSAQLMTIYGKNITNDLNISCDANSCYKLDINVKKLKEHLIYNVIMTFHVIQLLYNLLL